ncbi:MAG: hypothetical protein N2257_00205 [Thermodesulfovibrionales bacterium]|nr:hypothetical protein [Thermodesulfovibrionales bacterium]
MRETVKQLVKKVTLELIYQVVEERTEELKRGIEDIKKRQEEDFRYLNNKIDMQIGQLRQEVGQLRQEIGSVEEKINNKIDTQIGQLRQEMGQLNQRIDTVIQLLVEITKK